VSAGVALLLFHDLGATGQGSPSGQRKRSRSTGRLREPSEHHEVGISATRPNPGREARRPGGSQHPNHAGARLGRVDVVFEVASERYPLDERAATLMAEQLRVKAGRE
jgi:hypothetical protein